LKEIVFLDVDSSSYPLVFVTGFDWYYLSSFNSDKNIFFQQATNIKIADANICLFYINLWLNVMKQHCHTIFKTLPVIVYNSTMTIGIICPTIFIPPKTTYMKRTTLFLIPVCLMLFTISVFNACKQRELNLTDPNKNPNNSINTLSAFYEANGPKKQTISFKASELPKTLSLSGGTKIFINSGTFTIGGLPVTGTNRSAQT
jgi:hypothetical protein